MRQDFSTSSRAITAPGYGFKSGMVVSYYVDPQFTLGNEPSGNLVGMILNSASHLTAGTESALICPLTSARDEVSGASFAIPLPSGKFVFRPDMATSIGFRFMQPVRRDGQPIVYGHAVQHQVRAKFLDLIKPVVPENSSKLFLGKGILDWFRSIPFSNDTSQVSDPTPAVSLTPLAIAEQTEMAIICRFHSNFTVYRAFYHTPVVDAPGYKPSYFNSTDIVAVSTRRFKKNNLNMPLRVSKGTLTELAEKIEANLDDAVFERVKAKNLGHRIGDIPADVQRGLDIWTRKRLGSKYTKEFRM